MTSPPKAPSGAAGSCWWLVPVAITNARASDARPVDLDPALTEVGSRDRMREAEAITEDRRGVLEGVTQGGTDHGAVRSPRCGRRAGSRPTVRPVARAPRRRHVSSWMSTHSSAQLTPATPAPMMTTSQRSSSRTTSADIVGSARPSARRVTHEGDHPVAPSRGVFHARRHTATGSVATSGAMSSRAPVVSTWHAVRVGERPTIFTPSRRQDLIVEWSGER